MSDFVFDNLSASDAERVIAEIWTFAERYNSPSPKLSIVFRDGGHRLRLRAKFEEKSMVARMIGDLAQSLSDCAKRIVVNHAIGGAGAQPIEKIQPTLASGSAEPCEVVVADLRKLNVAS